MKYLIIFIVLLGFVGQAEGQSRADKKQAKKELKIKAFAELKAFFEQGAFQFVAEWAETQKGRRINLISNPNSFVKKGEVVSADLPYFGVVQVGNMSGDGGINIDAERLKEENIKYNEKKFRIVYSFRVNSSRGESFDCIFTIQANKTATLSVRSSQRNQISYTGAISPLI